MHGYINITMTVPKEVFPTFFMAFYARMVKETQTIQVKTGFNDTVVITATLQPDASKEHAAVLLTLKILYTSLGYNLPYIDLIAYFNAEKGRRLTVSHSQCYSSDVLHLEKFFWGVDVDLNVAYRTHYNDDFVRYIHNPTII